MDRTWRTSMTGTIDGYDLRFYPSCMPNTVNNIYLLVDTNGDGNFADETAAGGGVVLLTNSGPSEYSTTGLTNLVDGTRFTFGFGSSPAYISAFGPGGVGDNSVNRFWFDADDIAQGDGSAVATWNNKGGNANNLTQANNSYKPQFQTNQANGFPLVKFDGSNDFLALADNTDINLGGPFSSRTFTVMFRTGNDITSRQVIYEEGGGVRGLNVYIYQGEVYIGGYNLNADGADSPWGFAYLNAPVATSTDYILTYLYKGNSCGTGTIQMYLNGSLIGTLNNIGQLYAHSGDIGIGDKNADTYFENGSSSGDGEYFNGSIGEFIMYNYNINATQRIVIENYLAAKYGISLDANDLYTMDDAANGNYDFQVAGIGRLNGFDYDNDGEGPGIVRVQNPADLDDNEYFIWGHDNKVLNSDYGTDLPVGSQVRFERTWRASEAGEVGPFDISFDLSGVPNNKNASDLRLLVDRNNDGQFADETTGSGGIISGATDLGGGVFQFSGVNIDDGERFTIGSINFRQTPLPVTLLFFNANCDQQQGVKLQWATATEINNDYFTIERSTDGKSFEPIATVPGHGNSKQRIDYALTDDSPLQGIAYYRLKQTDFDGVSEYFKMVVASCAMNEPDIEIFPNPGHGIFTLQAPGQYQAIVIVDQIGKVVYTRTGLAVRTVIDLSGLPKGIYFAKIVSPIGTKTKKLVISK